jgi:hypothetical protein
MISLIMAKYISQIKFQTILKQIKEDSVQFGRVLWHVILVQYPKNKQIAPSVENKRTNVMLAQQKENVHSVHISNTW